VATPADFDAALEAFILGDPEATPTPVPPGLAATPTRFRSDYLDDDEGLAPGAARFQLRCNAAGFVGDSNASYLVVFAELVVKHALADPANERAYTKGAMQTDLATLTDYRFWRGLSPVHEIVDRPSVESERVGNWIVYTIAARVKLNP
jgi:hypothetical protein